MHKLHGDFMVGSLAPTSFDDPAVLQFRREVRTWLERSLPSRWRDYQKLENSEAEELEIRRGWDAALVGGGYRCINWPVEYGGRGLGPIENFVFYEEAALAHAPEELELIGKHLAGPGLLAWGTDDQKARYLPQIASGSEVWCEGLSEPNAGSDLAAVTTLAEWSGDRYRVHGRKIWTSFAHYADKCYLLAKTSLTERRHHNLTVLLLDMRQPGVHISPIRQLNNMHEFNEVVFDGAEVTPEDRLGKENDGWSIVTIAGQRKSLAPGQAPRRYVHMRHEFDQLVECSSEVGANVANIDPLQTKLDLLLWHMRRIVETVASDEDYSRAQSVLELYWSELWQEITRAGLSLDCPRHEAFWRRKYLESRPATVYGGSSELKRNVIADRTLALPR